MAKFDWSSKVKEVLDRTDIMALSTIGTDGPWTSPVQYKYSERCDLYFLSSRESKHVRNILKDPRVSVAIYKGQKSTLPGTSLGLQLKGKAKHVTERSDVKEAARYLGYEPSGEWQVFKITPEELWCFDSRGSGAERQKVDLAELELI